MKIFSFVYPLMDLIKKIISCRVRKILLEKFQWENSCALFLLFCSVLPIVLRIVKCFPMQHWGQKHQKSTLFSFSQRKTFGNIQEFPSLMKNEDNWWINFYFAEILNLFMLKRSIPSIDGSREFALLLRFIKKKIKNLIMETWHLRKFQMIQSE